jgi:hypothetical protein
MECGQICKRRNQFPRLCGPEFHALGRIPLVEQADRFERFQNYEFEHFFGEYGKRIWIGSADSPCCIGSPCGKTIPHDKVNCRESRGATCGSKNRDSSWKRFSYYNDDRFRRDSSRECDCDNKQLFDGWRKFDPAKEFYFQI